MYSGYETNLRRACLRHTLGVPEGYIIRKPEKDIETCHGKLEELEKCSKTKETDHHQASERAE